MTLLELEVHGLGTPHDHTLIERLSERIAVANELGQVLNLVLGSLALTDYAYAQKRGQS